MTEASDNQSVRVRPKRFALSIILAAGFAAGLLPFLFYQRFQYLGAVLLVYAFAVALWKLRSFATNASDRPGFLEWLFAGWEALGLGAVTSLTGFIWYALAYFLWWLIVSGAGLIGYPLAIAPATIATWVSVFFFAMMALATPTLLLESVPAKLYPQLAGTRSAFFPLAANPFKFLALIVAGIAAGIIALVIFDVDPHGAWFTVLLAIFLTGTGQTLRELGTAARPPTQTLEAQTMINRLLAAAGYDVAENPVTGDPEVDPLISGVDALATAGHHGYAIRVLSSTASEASWSVASELRTAAMVLQSALRQSKGDGISIDPLLLVIGGAASDALKEVCAEVGIRLVQHEDIGAARSIMATDTDAAELAEFALQYLEIPRAATAGASEIRNTGSVA